MKKIINGKLVIPLVGVVQSAQPKPPPHNPRTLPQQTQRGYLASISAHWRELTDEARETWRALGRALRGQPTGHQVYCQVNMTLVRCGLPQVQTAPDWPGFGLLTCAGLVADDTPQVKLLQVGSTLAAQRLLISATAPLSPGLDNPQRGYRQVAIVPGPTPRAADLDLTAVYLARFGRLDPGRRIFVRLTEMSNGFQGGAAAVPRPGRQPRCFVGGDVRRLDSSTQEELLGPRAD
jgi:hypothetical protein